MGIRDRPVTPRSPWQNPYVERLIGTLRRECLDHVLIFGEQHLRRVLTLYALYYNETRTHLGLAKDAPRRRAVQRCGRIDSLILTADGEMALTKIKALAETHEAHIAERVGPKRRMQLIDLLRDFG